jgi:hypothetical protein
MTAEGAGPRLCRLRPDYNEATMTTAGLASYIVLLERGYWQVHETAPEYACVDFVVAQAIADGLHVLARSVAYDDTVWDEFTLIEITRPDGERYRLPLWKGAEPRRERKRRLQSDWGVAIEQARLGAVAELASLTAAIQSPHDLYLEILRNGAAANCDEKLFPAIQKLAGEDGLNVVLMWEVPGGHMAAAWPIIEIAARDGRSYQMTHGRLSLAQQSELVTVNWGETLIAARRRRAARIPHNAA